jgi:hypothetical protein
LRATPPGTPKGSESSVQYEVRLYKVLAKR